MQRKKNNKELQKSLSGYSTFICTKLKPESELNNATVALKIAFKSDHKTHLKQRNRLMLKHKLMRNPVVISTAIFLLSCSYNRCYLYPLARYNRQVSLVDSIKVVTLFWSVVCDHFMAKKKKKQQQKALA
ncbi:hypothetical protein O9992_29380 [Vibrio lentus]|nr:hypothetical protein [Vibrio lentus]